MLKCNIFLVNLRITEIYLDNVRNGQELTGNIIHTKLSEKYLINVKK